MVGLITQVVLSRPYADLEKILAGLINKRVGTDMLESSVQSALDCKVISSQFDRRPLARANKGDIDRTDFGAN